MREKELNILHLNSRDFRGGSETVFNITRKNPFCENNYSGYYKTNLSSGGMPDVQFDSWEHESRIKGAIHYIYSRKNYEELLKFVRSRKIDVIHFHDLFSSLSVSVYAALKLIKKNSTIKIIQTVHDYNLVCPNSTLFNYSRNSICEKCIGKKIKADIIFRNCDRRGWFHSALKGIRSILAENIYSNKEIVDLYIAPSNFIKEKMMMDGISEDKIILLRNPIQKSAIEFSECRENIICYFGRLSKEKNTEFLLDTFIAWKNKTKNNYKFLIIGEGESESRLNDIAAKSEWANDVLFKPFLAHSDLMNEIKTAKYFTMASIWYENAPMVILEAVSAGLIPLVPDMGGMRETAADLLECGAVYAPNNSANWIRKIIDLEENYSSEFDRLKKSLSKIDEYSVENYFKKLSEIYSQLRGE